MSSPSRFTCARPGRQVHLACDPSHVEVFPPALILDIAGLGRPRWRPSAPRPTAPSPLARPCRPAATAQRNASRSATGNGWAARKTASSCSSVSRIGAMGSGHTAESNLPQRIANANSSGGSKSEPPEDKCVRHHARCALAWPCCRCLTRACAWTSQNLPTTRRVSQYPWRRCWRLQLSPPGR